ncbi:hypothetical protein ES332_D04G108800v1 [Gossypium tomentosum]|uniref:Uncharacterized protein n=1 Tax=Gossypium tomentosum TaxID=34277 RepID=A0A5D2LCI5_GOSTO|nr:hypothetical protein ES332_D04G108800v1 [Gossypium tomentosum]
MGYSRTRSTRQCVKAVRRRAWLGRTTLEAARVSASDFALGRFVIRLGSRQIGFKF